jgi:hypothetical protein
MFISVFFAMASMIRIYGKMGTEHNEVRAYFPSFTTFSQALPCQIYVAFTSKPGPIDDLRLNGVRCTLGRGAAMRAM